jgi:hypothetical protein
VKQDHLCNDTSKKKEKRMGAHTEKTNECIYRGLIHMKMKVLKLFSMKIESLRKD